MKRGENMELIDRVSFNNCWACIHHVTGKCDTWCDHGESFKMRDDVAKAEVIDAVPVVRCKNCEHYRKAKRT